MSTPLWLLTAGLTLLVSCLRYTGAVPYTCMAPGNHTTRAVTTADASKLPLHCVFSYIVGATIGFNIYPEGRRNSQPLFLRYKISPNISVAVDNVTSVFSNISVTTIGNSTVTLTLHTNLTGCFDCIFHHEPWEFIQVGVGIWENTNPSSTLRGKNVTLFTCARKPYSHQGVTSVYSTPDRFGLSLKSIATVCHDDNETTTVYNVTVERCFCDYMSILCMDAVGNFWIPNTLNRYGEPPSCISNRSIIPHPNKTSTVFNFSIVAATMLTPVFTPEIMGLITQKGPFPVLAIVSDVLTTLLILWLLFTLRGAIAEHRDDRLPNKLYYHAQRAVRLSYDTKCLLPHRHVVSPSYINTPRLSFHIREPWRVY
ncbi:membrane protein A25E [Aotine betaherpesvirus 1]|uniref:Membrane protein A25E n=1 Tax=Aotine betaherpesvirus 1 TaxID=50290 RepID=G8XUJ7_9BETA|nr:membrane protein A25E [Aotine betaherpesvirus 1]AEV80838.1 membrane protein A25E [Aotine betaherpesvirus 1]